MQTQPQSQNQTQKPLEDKWKSATLSNNFIFYKVMRDHIPACQKLIEMLLNIKIEHIELHTEEVIEIDFGAKGIRLDVYITDTGKLFDLELQVANTQELPERARYYAASMAVDSLKSGQKYKELSDSHVIFICMEDVFENELPVYTFENICLEDGKTKLNDRDYKHFFIAPTCAKMLEDEEIKSFFDFLVTGTPSSSFTKELEVYVAEAKQNHNYKRQFMNWERQRAYDFADGKQEGLQEGANKKALEDAENLLREGDSPEKIARCINLPIETVLELQKKITVNA